jgi:hypothetical protein
MILVTTLASLLCIASATLTLRAAAQTSEPETDESPDAAARTSKAPAREELPPDLRDSADNNISFPIDI